VLKAVLFFLILNSPIVAQKFYYIKLGSFKNWIVLEKSIDGLPSDMRSHIVVLELNGWLVPYAYYTRKLDALKRELHRYRRYFPDSEIKSSPHILGRSIFRDYRVDRGDVRRVYTHPETVTTQPYRVKERGYVKFASTAPVVKESSIVEEIRAKSESRDVEIDSFSKRILSGHKFYLTYKSPDGRSDLLIKLSFGGFKVKYQPIVGEMNMREAKYLVDNSKLYMFADTFSENGAYSKVESVTDDYMVVSSWFKGKRINSLRYYYNLDKAKRYLGKSSTSRLANALEERSFDRIEQAFIGVDGVFAINGDDEDW